MKNVTIVCDRCGKIVHGIIDETPQGIVTGGFYDVSDGYWAQFKRWEEERVCDDCMFADANYKKVYGERSPTEEK
jgi:hypothetical protein